MKVLVTGGSGFIGNAVITELVARGHAVVALDRRWRPERYIEDVEIHVGDIRDQVAVTESVAHVDGVIHLAGVLGTAETVKNPVPSVQTNIIGGLNVLDAVAQYSVPLVNIAVGNWWESSSYSITKNTVERFAKMHRRFLGTQVTTVRAMNAVGPGQSVAAPFGTSKVRKIGPSFMCRALVGQPVEVYGSGEQIMDIIHVKDVAAVLVSALEATADLGGLDEVIEAGSGASTSVNQIAQEVADYVTAQYGTPVEITHIPLRDGETPGAVVQADVSTMGVLAPYGIDPAQFTTLADVVADTVPYYRGYLSRHPQWKEYVAQA